MFTLQRATSKKVLCYKENNTFAKAARFKSRLIAYLLLNPFSINGLYFRIQFLTILQGKLSEEEETLTLPG